MTCPLNNMSHKQNETFEEHQYENGTPYSDEQWKAWYGIKNSSEVAMEQEEREEHDKIIDTQIDQARENQDHHHGSIR